MNIYELKVIHSKRKSFYGKASVKINQDGIKTLQSYTTDVLSYDPVTRQLTRLWDDWTATTGAHINEFALQETGKPMNKQVYLSLKTKGG